MVDTGILKLYSLSNVAAAGFMPTEKLVEQCSAYYSERTVGVTRLYAALGANRRIDMLVRVWNVDELPDDALYCIPEDGKQYRVDAVQRLPELGALELTLVRLEANYDVYAE